MQYAATETRGRPMSQMSRQNTQRVARASSEPPRRLKEKKIEINNLSLRERWAERETKPFLHTSFFDRFNEKREEINCKDDILELQSALLSKKETWFFNNVKELNFKALDISNEIALAIVELLTSIIQNLKLLPNLKSLKFGNMQQNVAFRLPEGLRNISDISVNNIPRQATFTLPEFYKNLISLSIGNVEGTLNLPSTLNNIKNLTYGTINSLSTCTFLMSITPSSIVDLDDVRGRKNGISRTGDSPENRSSSAESANSSRNNSPEIISSLSKISDAVDRKRSFRKRQPKESEKPEEVSLVSSETISSLSKISDTVDRKRSFRKRQPKESEKPEEPRNVRMPLMLKPRRVLPIVDPQRTRQCVDFSSIGQVPSSLLALLSRLESAPNVFIISLNIKTIDDIQQLQKILLATEWPTASKFYISLNQVQELNLQNIIVKASTLPFIDELLATISLNLLFFSNLTKLSIGDIADTVTFGNIADTVFDPTFFNQLTCLSIDALGNGVYWKLPKFFSKLTHFSIDRMDNDAILDLTVSCNELTHFSIGTISSDAVLKLPKSFDELTHFSIGSINSDAVLKLPKLLKKLTYFSIDSINRGAVLKLSESFSKLTHLSIGTIESDAVLKLPKFLPNLEQLFIRQIDNSSIGLLDSFEKLDVHKFTFGIHIENYPVHLQPTILQKAERIRNTLMSLFSIWHADLPNVISNADYDFKNILQFRLISKGFYDLMNYPNCLRAKAIASFKCKQLYPAAEESIKDKLMFAQNNSIPTVLKIESPVDLQELKELIPQKQGIIDQIDQLDLKKIETNTDFSDSIKPLFISLKRLVFLPKSINYKFTNLMRTIHDEHTCKLIDLILSAIKPIYLDISVDDLLSPSSELNAMSKEKLNLILKVNDIHEIDQLQSLLLQQIDTSFIKRIYGLDFGKIKFNDKTAKGFNLSLNCLAENLNILSNFQSLVIGNIKKGANLMLPEFLNTITTLSIRDIFDDVFKLPDSFHNLTKLDIGYIDNKTQIHLPYNMPQLAELSIKHIGNNSLNIFPKLLPKLEKLALEYIYDSEGFNLLTKALDNVQTLFIKYIDNGCSVNLSNSLKDLKNLSIENIDNGSTLKIEDILENLTTLSIGCIDHNSSFHLKSALPNLTDLSIEHIDNDSKISLPESLPSLQKLAIQGHQVSTLDASLNKDIYAEIRGWLESNKMNRESV